MEIPHTQHGICTAVAVRRTSGSEGGAGAGAAAAVLVLVVVDAAVDEAAVVTVAASVVAAVAVAAVIPERDASGLFTAVVVVGLMLNEEHEGLDRRNQPGLPEKRCKYWSCGD